MQTLVLVRWDFCAKYEIIEPKLMRGIWVQRQATGLLVAVCCIILGAGTVVATTSQSPSFELSEPEFGAGSALEMCSGEYCARASIGDVSGGVGTGDSTSAVFTGGLGTVTEPLFEVIIEPGVANLGVLSPDETRHRTMVVKVRTYLSDGYTVQIVGDPPRYEGHTLQAPTIPTASQPGTEQFGLNVVANTIPFAGANPLQVPSGDMSFGYVTADYQTPNLFKYQSGDVVARSDSESGQTDYTVTMIVNVAGSTPAGHFVGDYAAIITPRF